MLCAISGEPPQEPVVSKRSGNIFEKRLIEKYVEEHGKDPVTGDELDVEDLLPIKTARVVRPRPATLTSIPALLSAFQNEWDSLALESYTLKEHLARTREELATALYQHDAAVRVIARLTKERDEARDALSKVTIGPVATSNGDAMAVDNEALPENIVAIVEETHQRLQKSRKKRPLPEGWASTEDVAALHTTATTSTPYSQVSSITMEGDYAAIGSLEGDVAIYSLEADKIERSLQVGEPITATIWAGSRVMVSTSKGSVKVFDGGKETASFSEHAGPATGIALHPCGDILASVGTDKSFIFYHLASLKRIARVHTSSSLTTCAFHPDGHLFAAGTSAGDIKLYMTSTGEEAATFSLGAPIQSLVFSENGYWFAAVAKGQTAFTVFDLRKSGDAAVAKELETGGLVQTLAWDYSGQYIATAGPAGMTVQQYVKATKAWSEPLRSAVPAVAICWGTEAKSLVAANRDGVVTVLGLEKE